jgi:Dolichyl-phosphate-mannose-protein mannosyltransferase
LKAAPGAAEASGPRLQDWAGVAVPVVATAIFLAFWWRSYLAVTNDGWHFFGAWRILHGEVPYRDYYLFIPPFHQLKIAAIIALFGKTLIAAQAVGFAERLVLAGVIYFWLRKAFGPAESALGSTFGLFVYYSGSSETLSSMIHEAAIWAVFAGASAAAAVARGRRRCWWIAGLFAGVAFITKQTSGVGIAAALFSFAGWRAVGPGGDRGKRVDLAALGGGWCIPVSLVAVWLGAAGALPAFLDQVYLRGPSSKGGMSQILVRPMLMLVDNVW